MKIKRYTALSMRAALALVRAEQGPDAVILSSRRGEDGIEVHALDVEHEADLRLGIDGAAQHESDLIDFLALPRIVEYPLNKVVL